MALKKVLKEAGYSMKSLADVPDITFITSGVAEIDKITGGLPRGRISEIYGMQGVGKSDLMLTCISSMSHEGKVLYIDAENAINPLRLKSKGGIAKNITITDLDILEDAAELTIKSVGKYDVIVVDSIATLIPRSEYEGEVGDQFVMLKARLMGQWMRKIVGTLGKSNTALVFINQLRESPNMYVPKFTPGGKAMPYAASLRLELSTKKADQIIREKAVKGHKVKVEVTKSRVCDPHQITYFDLIY